MNEIEVVKLPNGIEGFLSELKPATKTKWNFEARKDEIDDSSATLEKVKAGCEIVKNSLRDIYLFGEMVSRGTPKFCLALSRIYNNLHYVEDSSAAEVIGMGGLRYKPSLSYWGSDKAFSGLVGKLGLSSTSAYRYKDLAHFVDEKTEEYYTEFQGYSISLLSEIWAYAVESYNSYLDNLKKLVKIIPANTTIEDMRLFRKVMKLLEGYKGVFKNYKYEDKEKLQKKTVSAVLKVYNELVQKEETKKLEATMSGVTEVAEEDKSVKVLPATDEITIKKEEYQKINSLAQKAVNIGNCTGCKHNGTNLNKCRCCRRYESLKDLFEEN